jgi:hypothetical protein
MNRAQKRLQEKKDKTKKYSLQEVQKALHIAIEMMKISKGHLFSAHLKDRCVFCGVTTKTKKKCDYWAMTMIDRMQTTLINPDFFRDDEIQALWLQHGEEYQNIKLPLALGAKSDKKD